MTRGRRRRERRHERELDRRGQRWNRTYEKRTDTRNNKGINLIYYCNAMGITKHGLRPVTLQSSVVTIVLESNPAYASPTFWGTSSSFKYLFPYTEPSCRHAVILGLGVHWRSYLLVFPYRRLLIPWFTFLSSGQQYRIHQTASKK